MSNQSVQFDPISALLGEDQQNKKHESDQQKAKKPNHDEIPQWRDVRRETPTFVREKDQVSKIKIISFFALLGIGFLIGLLFFLRPTVSETEKRELTPFPSLTWSSFWSGDFTKEVSVWYADTYPLREGMIRASQTMKTAYGIQSVSIKITEHGEDIPTEIPDDIDQYIKDHESETDQPVNPVEGQTINNLYVSGDTAYELYAFNTTAALKYAQAINKAAEALSGKAQVYNVLVPLSYSINLPESTATSLGASSAKDAIRYIFSVVGDNVRKVQILDELTNHKDEYLYFRTDHHWTALGAYYAYVCVCQEMGMSPMVLSDYRTTNEIPGFLGTLYADAGQPASLKSNPDTVVTFKPNSTNDIIHYDGNGTKYTTYGIINGVSKTSNKYLTFLGGDFAYSEIHNPDKHDGSSVLLVKESFGNAFAPFLVDSFEYVYIVDYRYYKEMTLAQLVDTKGIQKVIILNNLVATTATARINELNAFFGS